MNPTTVSNILEAAYGKDLAEKIVDSYREIEENFSLKKWKPSELDAGHFVEAVRRIVEKEVLGMATPLSQHIETFTDKVLLKYENGTGDESFRILIPRVLKSIYGIRNKRGIGHLGSINANEMDATLILYSVKWVLSEIIRLKSNLSIPDTQKLIDTLVERRIGLLFKKNGITRFQTTKLKRGEEVLVLLLDRDEQTDYELSIAMKYKNYTRFKADILRPLDKKGLIVYEGGICHITDTGKLEAEKIILGNRI